MTASSSSSFSIASIASGITTFLGELVGPTRCAACDVRLGGPHILFCPACAASVNPIPTWETTAGGCVAPFEYGGAISTAIMRFKYGDRADLAPRLGLAMWSTAKRLRHVVDVVVPVPLHPKRLAERGYNQAALLAAPIAERLGVRMAPWAMTRAHDTRKQALLDRTERLVNLRGAFRVRQPELIKGSRVLLVDDVRTTGVTLDTCAAALHEVGARVVLGLVLARSFA